MIHFNVLLLVKSNIYRKLLWLIDNRIFSDKNSEIGFRSTEWTVVKINFLL